MKKYFLLLFFILLCQGAGFLGVPFTTQAIPSWYGGLVKPSFSPPNWLFGPVWILLYTLMGLAVWLVWQKKGLDKELKVFFVHLFLNAIWTPVFFGAKQLGLAFLVIGLIWGMIVWLIILFEKVDKKASLLLIPYLAWVSFAGILNFSLWQLNH